MKLIVLALALVGVASAASISDPSLDLFWEEFTSFHNKKYASPEEATLRYLNFIITNSNRLSE